MTMTLIETVTVGSGGASTINFTNIPQDAEDLVCLFSLRNADNSTNIYFTINNNSATSVYSRRQLQNDGGAITVNAYGTNNFGYLTTNAVANRSTSTANTFSNGHIYLTNYKNAAAKTAYIDSVEQNNSSSVFFISLATGGLNTTSPITSLKLESTTSFAQNSTASLYKIIKTRVSQIFDFVSGTQGFTGAGATVTASGGILSWAPTAADPQLISPTLSVLGSESRYIKITWKRSVVSQSTDWAGQIFYTTTGHGTSESFTKFISQPTWTSDYQTTTIDMGSLNAGGNDYITSIVTGLRFDFTNSNDGASLLIDKIELSPDA